MAFIEKRPNRKGVYVYYQDPKTGKQMQIPRSMTKHLDTKPHEEQLAWVEKWEKEHGLSRERSRRMFLQEGDRLGALWNQYQEQRAKTRRRRETTRTDENVVWHNRILPFFVGKHYKKDPEDWHDLVPAFHGELFGSGLGDQSIRKALWTLERFGKHLVFHRIMTFPYAVQVPSTENRKITPLKIRITPDDIIHHVKKKMVSKFDSVEGIGGAREIITPDELKLGVLIAYFAALAPSELFALTKEDFLTGDHAEEATKTLLGFREAKLGTRLSVSISKTLPKVGKNPISLTKNDYRTAVVNIWHKEAAMLIAELLKKRPPGRIFPLAYRGMFGAWEKHVAPNLGATFHDLRRSSCLYLGRTMRLPATLIQEHMRHAELSTTLLYMREPNIPEKVKKVTQDFGDVL